jgi:geranylgeranyl diphosphate synthase type II
MVMVSQKMENTPKSKSLGTLIFMTNANNFVNYLFKISKTVNKELDRLLPKDKPLIDQTMRYAVLNGGKRLRPALVILAADLFGVKAKDVLPAACALEFVHSYSLVHDDLPAMDNDDLRRGKPTVHKKFGEAAAILCGDALLTESFNLITNAKSDSKNINLALKVLSKYSGYRGMIDGQLEDTLETGRWDKKNKKKLALKLEYIQLQKTSALIIASLEIGAVLAGADDESIMALKLYGAHIGCAFQITDDILDVYGNKKLLGKKGSDADNNKLTALSLFGRQEAGNKAKWHIENAKKTLKIFGSKAQILEGLADFILARGY